MDVQARLRQGILAAKAGRKEEARRLLVEVVEADEKQLYAWLWLSHIVDDLAEKEICLENVLILEPNNQHTQQGLNWVRARRAKMTVTADSPATTPAPMSPTGQAEEQAIFDPSSGQEIMSREAAISAGYLVEDEFENEWLCPYCLAPTKAEDKVCPGCRRSLIVKKRLQPERSVWLWRGIFLQLYMAIYILVAGLAYFSFTAKWRGIPNPLLFWPLYFGLPVQQPDEQVAQVLAILPPLAFWLLIGAALYSLSLMVILYFRLPFGHLLYLFNSGLTLLLGLIGLLLGEVWVVQLLGGIGVALSLLQLLITFNLWKDFTFQETRLRLTLDRDAKSHNSLYHSARTYGAIGMWGNVALHLRRAAAVRPDNLDYQLGLTVAYLNLKRYDLARKSLAEAERLDPQAPPVKQLQQKLAAFFNKP